jgi:hypothetical protein
VNSTSDKLVIRLGVLVGLLLVVYAIHFFATPRPFAEPAGQLKAGMSRREVLDVMRYPPGRYGRPFQRYRGGYASSQPSRPGTPSYSFQRWEGSDAMVVVGYDDHGRVNNIWIDPAR